MSQENAKLVGTDSKKLLQWNSFELQVIRLHKRKLPWTIVNCIKNLQSQLYIHMYNVAYYFFEIKKFVFARAQVILRKI